MQTDLMPLLGSQREHYEFVPMAVTPQVGQTIVPRIQVAIGYTMNPLVSIQQYQDHRP